MEFLSPEWFSDRQRALRERGPVTQVADTPVQVVFLFSDAPSEGPTSMTLTFAPSGATLVPGVVDNATLEVVLRCCDAEAIFSGATTSADSLREGRVKIRGDAHALIELAGWLTEI